MASVNGATCAICIESPSILIEFLTPATSDNVETAKNFKLWTELNFLNAPELFQAPQH
jgi:hypothetical protein